MAISDLLVNSKVVFRRIGQVLLVLFAIWCGFAEPPATTWLPDWWYAGLALISAVALVVWDLRAMASYGLYIFPHGTGTFRPQLQQGVGRFLSLIELASRFRWRSGGIYVGRPLPQHRLFGLLPWNLQVGPPDDRHMLTIAGARSGKGTAVIIPNLLHYPGSVLVIDPKGELAQITASRRGKGSARVIHSLGQDVFILDPEDIVEGHPRACWNPLAELDVSSPHIWGRVTKVSLALVPTQVGAQEFFANHARDFLTALIMHVLLTEPPEHQNLIYIRRLVTQGDQEVFDLVAEECHNNGTEVPYQDAFEAMLGYMVHNHAHSGKISGIAQQLVGLAEETRSGVIGTLVEQTGFLDHESMEKTLQRSDFSLGDLKTRPTTIYICLTGTSLAGPIAKVMSILLELSVTRLEEIPGRPPHNVLFIMDEFYCLGRSEAIDRAMGLIAGYGLTLWPILQHVGQLQKHYPATWDNFMRNCRAVQYFGDQSPEMLKQLEARIGDRVYRKKDGTEDRRPFLPFSELASNYFTRESRRQIVLFQQQPAAPLALTHYFEHERLFPKTFYDDDPRKVQRSQYAAWHQP